MQILVFFVVREEVLTECLTLETRVHDGFRAALAKPRDKGCRNGVRSLLYIRRRLRLMAS